MKAPIPDITKDMFDLTGYCTIVTGASMGIGLSMAEALAHRGSDLVLVSRNAERLAEAAAKVRALGRRVVVVAADVTDDDAPKRIVEAALSLGGRIDVLVNNAGFMTFADPLNVKDDTWDEIFNVNVRAPMRITRAVLAEMIKANRGSVINIGSSWSTRASVFNQDGGGVDYCSSKAALHALTRATAQDMAPHNIRVNTIAPGAVDTPMHADHRALLFEFEKYIPLGRIQVAEDLAGAVIFLASDASAYITGQTLHVNGGLLMVD
ncbi:MAG TPA: SDR family oxidoreductase [Verrucomicrobiota bacterium]|nr:SDR family oxidoreductase [Verrucomicrobiota bacterium]